MSQLSFFFLLCQVWIGGAPRFRNGLLLFWSRCELARCLECKLFLYSINYILLRLINVIYLCKFRLDCCQFTLTLHYTCEKQQKKNSLVNIYLASIIVCVHFFLFLFEWPLVEALQLATFIANRKKDLFVFPITFTWKVSCYVAFTVFLSVVFLLLLSPPSTLPFLVLILNIQLYVYSAVKHFLRPF